MRTNHLKKGKTHLKKGVGRRNIINLIKDGVNSPKEIREKLRMTEKTFWYHKKRAINDGEIIEEKGKLKIVFDRSKIVEGRCLKTILPRVKSRAPMVRKLGLEDLRLVSKKKLITDRETLKFVSGIIENEGYSQFKPKLQEVLLNTIGHAKGTRFEEEISKIVPEKLLEKWAIDTKNDPEIRMYATESLVRRDKFDILFNLIVEPRETYQPISTKVRSLMISHIKREKEEAREKLYDLLENHADNHEISKRIHDTLEDTKDHVSWLTE